MDPSAPSFVPSSRQVHSQTYSWYSEGHSPSRSAGHTGSNNYLISHLRAARETPDWYRERSQIDVTSSSTLLQEPRTSYEVGLVPQQRGWIHRPNFGPYGGAFPTVHGIQPITTPHGIIHRHTLDGGMGYPAAAHFSYGATRPGATTGIPRMPGNSTGHVVQPYSFRVAASEPSRETNDLAIYSFSQLRLKCNWCGNLVFETDPATILCNGCGPFTTTRYCHDQHLLYDVRNHWKICGGVSFLFRVDPRSLPHPYAQFVPAIENRHGMYTAALQRQRAWNTYRHHEADYFLFSDWRESKGKNSWVHSMKPSHRIRWKEDTITKDVVNRIINLCFFDHKLVRPLALLYRLLRMALRNMRKWQPDIEQELCSQFFAEFRIDPLSTTSRHDSDASLWEEWAGHGDGVQRIVEEHENRHPILRLWRREHPDPTIRANRHWDRFYGRGYPNAVPPGHNGFSPGWNGFDYTGVLRPRPREVRRFF